MIEPDDAAIEALRRFDQPHDPDDASLRRIEARMLARFDEASDAGPTSAAVVAEVVELEVVDLDARTGSRPRPRRGVWLGLAAAAVVAALGAIVLLRSDPSDPVVPSTQPPPTPVEDDATSAAQLASYCERFIVPLDEVSALWVPQRYETEARADVLVAVEQAAQGLVDLPAPVAARFGDRDLELLDLATEARKQATLRPDDDETLALARDSIVAEVDAVAGELGVEECELG